MLSVLAIVLPVFALIASGFIVRRLDVIGRAAVPEINKFVVYLALPALLFDVMAHASYDELAQPGFISAFGLSCGLVFFAVLGWLVVSGRPLASASIDGLLGSYANTAYMGFPVLLMVYGPESQVPVTIASIITVCVLNASAIVLIEVASHRHQRLGLLVRKVGGSLMRNPIFVAPVLGMAYGATGLGLAAPVDAYLKLLGGAASPLALVVIGLVLAELRSFGGPETRTSLALAGLKLIVHPLLTWALAIAFAVPAPLAAMAVLLAALPTGAGPFIVAEHYRLPALVTSTVILVSTIGSLVTLPIFMLALGAGVPP
jgi:malonate transporter